MDQILGGFHFFKIWDMVRRGDRCDGLMDIIRFSGLRLKGNGKTTINQVTGMVYMDKKRTFLIALLKLKGSGYPK